MTYGSLNGVDN